MSKHLPNCPHLSKYDGLGDAGMIMAINEKHRKNNSYEYQDSNDIDKILNTIEKTESYFDEIDEYMVGVDRYVNEVNNYIQQLKEDKEKCCRDAYISGYKQAKKDLKHKVYRSPYAAFIEYWDSQSQ